MVGNRVAEEGVSDFLEVVGRQFALQKVEVYHLEGWLFRKANRWELGENASRTDGQFGGDFDAVDGEGFLHRGGLY